MITPIQPKQNDPAEVVDTDPSVQPTSLPLELWILVFKENVDPQHLWNVGRQVCSSWRAEIPKVVAKKYLEDRRMTEVASSCPLKTSSSISCLMGRRLAFDRYKGKNRMVFADTGIRDKYDHDDQCNAHFALMKEARSQNINDLHNRHPTTCLECTDKTGGKRCDLPSYFIRIKKNCLTTELCGLEIDFAKGEISFEWEAMLTAYYREAAVLERRVEQVAREAIQWFGEEKRSLASVLRRASEDRRALWGYSEEVRTNRMKSWHCHASKETYIFDHDYYYEARWADLERRGVWERNSFFDRFNKEDTNELPKSDYHAWLDHIGRLQIGDGGGYEHWLNRSSTTRLELYEGDEQGDSALWEHLCERMGWQPVTLETREVLEARCVLQWLGMGVVQSLPTTKV
jgi:hypothetical protein